ncbi:MAG: glycosyltransferase family 2 protein [Lactobacillaceae bacterium]|jgi:CDP-glycerol glycerophosphotransferase|nr:glycosyltransferase family 2 protein [Lactobacillaceae bacterium]
MQSNTTNLSVIIPHHNDETRLVQLLASIPPDMPVIVVDNNSNHDFAQFKMRLEQLGQAIIVKRVDIGGSGTARNAGIQLVQTPWFIFADSDDKFTADLQNITTKLNEAVDLYLLPPIILQEDSDQVDTSATTWWGNKVTNNAPDSTTYRMNWAAPWSKIYRTAFIKATNISFPDVPLAEDWSFALRVGQQAQAIEGIPTPIYIWQKRSGSSMTFSKAKSLGAAKEIAWADQFTLKHYGVYAYRKDWGKLSWRKTVNLLRAFKQSRYDIAFVIQLAKIMYSKPTITD